MIFSQETMLTESETTIMKVIGVLVGMLVEIVPEARKDPASCDGNENKMMRASIIDHFQVMIKVAMLHCKQCG